MARSLGDEPPVDGRSLLTDRGPVTPGEATVRSYRRRDGEKIGCVAATDQWFM